jgi:catechol 2,3-dioxygenase-like lactoylglutathione lyase family enzyme
VRQDGEPERRKIVDWKIEVVTIPVSDIDRARDFYADKVGFNVDIDYRISDDIRLVQLTPPGSACSIHLGKGTVDMEPGSIDGVFLVVPDVLAARADLTERGVEVGEVQVFDEGAYRPAREGEPLDNVGCIFFSDPDGNHWCVQQIPARN